MSPFYHWWYIVLPEANIVSKNDLVVASQAQPGFAHCRALSHCAICFDLCIAFFVRIAHYSLGHIQLTGCPWTGMLYTGPVDRHLQQLGSPIEKCCCTSAIRRYFWTSLSHDENLASLVDRSPYALSLNLRCERPVSDDSQSSARRAFLCTDNTSTMDQRVAIPLYRRARLPIEVCAHHGTESAAGPYPLHTSADG